MGKDVFRAYLRWLDQASNKELAEKHVECVELLATMTDAQYRADMRRIIRLMEEEQMIRLGIHQRMTAKGSNSPK